MKYLFCTSANFGYVYSALYLAHQLRDLGHTVYFLTGPEFTAVLQEQGFSNLLPNTNDKETFAVQSWTRPLGHIKTIQYLDKIQQEQTFDALIAGALSFSVPLFAKWYNIPSAVLGLATYTGATHDNFRNQSLTDYFTHQILPAIYKHFQLPINSVTNADVLGDLFLLRTIPPLESNTLPDHVHFIGDCLWEPENLLQKNQDLAEFLDTKEAVIYVQHDNRFVGTYEKNGTSLTRTDFLPLLVEWAKDKPIRLVVATRDKELIHQQWGEKVYIQTHIPRQEIMPYVDLTITNGTTGIVLASLVEGVPLLFINPHSEGIRLSQIFTEAQLALHIDTDENASPLTSYIDDLLNNPIYRQNAQKMQEQFTLINQQKAGAQLLEQLAYQKSPMSRSETFLKLASL